MKRFLRAQKTKLKAFREDRSGSATIETVYSVAMLCLIIVTALSLVAYALQITHVNYAAKRIARYVEIKGQAQQMELDTMMRKLLGNANEIDAEISIESDDWDDAYSAEKKLEYRGRFNIIIKATYKIPIINPGSGANLEISAPITVIIPGQSEKFWK